MDKIAVVILNWNGCDMLRSFLPSVVRFSEVDGAVVYVADNGSTDASVAMLRREFPSVHLILLEENHGFADGYNLALKQVEAEYVVLLNSDVEVTEHWLVPLAEYMDAYPETAACQPKIRSWRNKGQFEYAGAAGGFIDRYGYPFCRGRIMGVVEEARRHGDTHFLGYGGGSVHPSGRLPGSGWAGRTFFCPHGGDRFMLAASCPWQTVGMYTAECGISCGRGHFEEGESAQDLPQFS